MMPPPGVPSEELMIARFRGHARRLFWSALVLVATFGATAYFYDNLPAPFENWMLLSASGALVLLLVVVPYVVWLSRRTTVTTRRVIAHRGVGSTHRREMSHARGYTIAVRRGPLQRMWGTGSITLSNGVDAPLVLQNVPNVTLVHETLADQIEVSQILAHRDAQSTGNDGSTER
jgi:membrane protein YdbS with pleckstrin-like domain